MAINDNGLQFRHPHVTSNINSEEIIFDQVEATTSFFYAAVTEKGEDNRTVRISSSAEYIKKYGLPNMKKYGQAGYNIVNLLDSGAEVYLLRVLPDDATYAHAFLNIQTMVIPNGKKIKDLNGKLVSVDDIHLRVTTSYSEMQSNSKEALKNELMTERETLTIDGYKDNLLLCMYPTGRGKAYNNMAFRLTLNTSYDEMYDFRVYTLEVIEYDEFNTSNIIEGPFYVSLDPDAMGSNGESMFIVDILNRYSKNIKCIFNEKIYDRISTLINPEVNPSHLDILSGQTKIVNGQPETFYNSKTLKNEDVHLALQKYDVNGEKVLENGFVVLNYASALDKAIQTSVDMDNALRRSIYESYEKMLKAQSKVLGEMLQGRYSTALKTLITVNDAHGDKEITSGTYKTKRDLLENKLNLAIQTIFTDGIVPSKDDNESTINPDGIFGENPEGYLTLSKADAALSSVFEELITELEHIIPYIRMVEVTTGTTTTVPAIEQCIDSWKRGLNTKESFLFDTNNVYRKTLDLIDKLVYAETIVDTNSKAEKIIAIFSEFYVSFLPVLELLVKQLNPDFSTYKKNSGSVVTVKPFEEKIKVIEKLCELILKDIQMLNNQYLTKEFIEDIITKKHQMDETYNLSLLEAITQTFEHCLKLISTANPVYALTEDYAMVAQHSKLSILGTEFESALGKAVASSIKEYDTQVQSTEGKKNIMDDAHRSIDEEKVKLEALRSSVLTNALQSRNTPSKLNGGSDGNIDDANVTEQQRQTNINSLLVKGYKGLIDTDITNTKLMQFKYLLDANYDLDVKNAMVSLVRDIRQDLFAWLDTEYCNSPEEALSWRINKFPISTEYVCTYTQDFIIFDEFQGRDTKVTMSYFLAKKIPQHANKYGLHYPMAGSRRGIIDGYKENSVSFFPNALYKEQLYNRQINYLETDGVKTKLGSQLTSNSKITPLSNINNVLTILDMKRNVDYMAESLIFEFNDEDTVSSFQQELNAYLDKYVSNRACESVSASVYASDYDKQQKILRISLSIKFNDVIERVIINLNVVK